MNIKFIITLIFVGALSIAVVFVFMSKNSNVAGTATPTSFPVVSNISNKPASLTELFNQDLSNEHNVMMSLVQQNEYYLQNCTYENRENKTLILVAKYSQDENGNNTFASVDSAMKNFEDNVYADWGSVLFGNKYVPATDVPEFQIKRIKNLNIAADYYKFTKISKNHSLYYGWVLNYLLISTNETCLLNAMEELYPIH